jgi:hypothetical protein
LIDVNVTSDGQYCSVRDVKLSEHRSAARSVNELTASPKTTKDNGRQTPKAAEAIIPKIIPNNSVKVAYRN